MTTRTIDAPASATVIRDPAEAVRVAADLAARFCVEAADRDLHRRLPDREIEELTAAGLYGITVPRVYGGADVPVRPERRGTAAARPGLNGFSPGSMPRVTPA